MSIDHRAEALRLAEESHGVLRPNDEGPCEADRLLMEAQMHATLHRGDERASTAQDVRDALTLLRRREYAIRELVSQHIAMGLASRDKDRWKAAIDLSRALDEADCNMDALVDARLSDNGWDPRSAYKTPASLTASDDPWAPTPDIAAAIPDRVRRVLVEYLAAALLSKGDAHGVGRTITFALKDAGADLTGDIEKQIAALTLGADPSDPPF